jgi:hypothetical protein
MLSIVTSIMAPLPVETNPLRSSTKLRPPKLRPPKLRPPKLRPPKLRPPKLRPSHGFHSNVCTTGFTGRFRSEWCQYNTAWDRVKVIFHTRWPKFGVQPTFGYTSLVVGE